MAKAVYLVPDGPKNLASLYPSVNFRKVADYYIEVLDVNNNVVATTPILKVCNCFDEQGVRFYFLNDAGCFDAINFDKPEVLHEHSGQEYKNSLSYPLEKTDSSTERFNVNANDTYECRRKSTEAEMNWLREAADSVKAFMDWTGIEGRSDSYIPVLIINGRFEKLKNDREFQYDFVLQFKLSNEYFTQRG